MAGLAQSTENSKKSTYRGFRLPFQKHKYTDRVTQTQQKATAFEFVLMTSALLTVVVFNRASSSDYFAKIGFFNLFITATNLAIFSLLWQLTAYFCTAWRKKGEFAEKQPKMEIFAAKIFYESALWHWNITNTSIFSSFCFSCNLPLSCRLEKSQIHSISVVWRFLVN